MFEKVNPSHPDKVADRIAGAIVDLAYSRMENPKVAVEVLIGHNKCLIINETNCPLDECEDIIPIVYRISKNNNVVVEYIEVEQDIHLANNQSKQIRCGDNGIFKGTPITQEQRKLTDYAKLIYEAHPYDGKYLINDDKITVCQSNCEELPISVDVFNPLGYWEGGINVDSGATNRKLGSDMGDGVTGGGLHGKDLSKADVTLNICCFLLAQGDYGTIKASCNIGDTFIIFEDMKGRFKKPYAECVEIARAYIKEIGGFEKFAEWGLIR